MKSCSKRHGKPLIIILFKEWNVSKQSPNEHRALAAQHEYYARAYEALAFLEYDKDGLLKIMINKLNSVALDPFGGPIDLEREERILEIICKTQEEFQNGLPKDKSQQ